MRIGLFIHSVAVFSLILVQAASATTYYVSPQGKDSAVGEVNSPLKTIQKALSKAIKGDAIILRSGTFTLSQQILINKESLYLKGEGNVVITGSTRTSACIKAFRAHGLVVENITFEKCKGVGLKIERSDGVFIHESKFLSNGNSGFLSANSSDLVVEDSSALSNGSHGIYLSQSGDRLRVSRCIIKDNQAGALQVNALGGSRSTNKSYDWFSDTVTIEDVYLEGNGRKGGGAITLMGVRGGKVSNNLVVNDYSQGLVLTDDDFGSKYGSKNNLFVNNTFLLAPTNKRAGVRVSKGSTGNRLSNNIIVTGSGQIFDIDEPIISENNTLIRREDRRVGSSSMPGAVLPSGTLPASLADR